MNKNFAHLEWDTSFFGFKVGKIQADSISLTKLKILLNSLKEKRYTLVYLFLNKEIEYKLSSYTLKLVDKKITYVKKISPEQLDVKDIKKYEFDYPNKDLIDLAIESGIYSRFNTDKNIKKEKFQELYKQWIINSVNKKIAKEVLVYNQDNKNVGLVTLGEKNYRGDIGIIAVNKNYRAKKIASKLINSAELYFEKRGYSEIQVVTQGGNKPACKLYEKNGFEIDKIQYVYHAWL